MRFVHKAIPACAFAILALGQPGRNLVSQKEFANALISTERSSELSAEDDIYGCLVGSWEVKVFDRADDGTVLEGTGEWVFSRVLEGRAIQDVWISPPISLRATNSKQRAANRYGSTFRYFDKNLKLWHIIWINPVSGVRNDLVAKRVGNEIVHTGMYGDQAIRWIFSEITRDSFRWTGESLQPDGRAWRLEAEFRAKRIGT